jgi:hypothetical protein
MEAATKISNNGLQTAINRRCRLVIIFWPQFFNRLENAIQNTKRDEQQNKLRDNAGGIDE